MHLAHERELALRPPPEFFLGIYFRAREWWEPPEIEGGRAPLMPVPENERPEFEP